MRGMCIKGAKLLQDVESFKEKGKKLYQNNY